MSRIFTLAAATALTVAQGASAADLSPASWPAAERAKLEALETSPYPAAARTVSGAREMVSATLSPIAVHAGMEALRQGGTAADAAIATALTQNVTDLGAVVSYAGEAELVYYEAATGRTYVMDAGWATWSGERDPASLPTPDLAAAGLSSADKAAGAGAEGRKTLVPGFMAGMEAAHRKFGRLPWAELFQPSIWYAQNGVTITPLLGAYFQMEKDKLSRTAEGRTFLAQAGDALPKAGDRFVQPELAKTLSGVAREGARYMYDGPWGEAYVATVKREGGAASMEDMRRYQVMWEAPLSVGYAGATVEGPGASSEGGCAVLAGLNLLDAAGGPKLGPTSSDPESFAAQTRIARFTSAAGWNPALASFEHAKGFASSCAGRLDPAWAKAVLPQIAALTGEEAPGHHSDAVVAVDRWGDVAALVHSINSLMWGETGIVVGGVPISAAASINKARLAGLTPGAHVPTDMAPVIAFRDGRPVAAVASIGSSLVPETMRIAAGLLDGQAPTDLAAAPPMLMNFTAMTSGKPLGLQPTLVPAGAYPAEFKARVEATGLKLEEAPPLQAAALRGTAAFVRISPDGLTSAEATKAVVFGDGR